jgi:hypothetical protein
MIESAPATDAPGATGSTEIAVHRSTRLYQVLAWVGIVAGILFIVAVVFFSGFLAARTADGYGLHRDAQIGQMRPGGPMGAGCPMMQMQGGGMGSGGMAPGGARASNPTTPPPPVGQR